MLVAEQFLQGLVNKYWKHPISTDGGTWYPQACRFLKLKYHLYIHCMKKGCKLQHVRDWFNLFIDYYNKRWLLKLTAPGPDKVWINRYMVQDTEVVKMVWLLSIVIQLIYANGSIKES
jgi:hypothetical protein